MSLECIPLLHLCLYLRTLVLSLTHLVPTQRVFWRRITNPVTLVSLPYLLVCHHQFPQPSAIPPLRFLCFLAASLLRSTGYMLNPVFSVFISFGLSAFWHSWSFFLLEIPFFFFFNSVYRISDWPCFFRTFWTFSRFLLLILPKSLRPQTYMPM